MTNAESYLYNSVILAKYIVAFANKRRITINITKVQKLLYIAYGIFLVVKNSRLTNEHPQAWPYGPVFPTTRNKLVKLDLDTISFGNTELEEISKDAEINSLLDIVFDAFGSWSASQLSEWSHGDNTPWQKTVMSDDFRWGMQIPDEHIKEYFNDIVYGEEK